MIGKIDRQARPDRKVLRDAKRRICMNLDSRYVYTQFVDELANTVAEV